MKCEICKDEVGEIFLEKKLGTFIKKEGKKYLVCSNCQKNLKTKDKIIDALVA